MLEQGRKLAIKTTKGTVKATKAAIKLTISTIKAIIAAVKSLVGAIVAGGWIAVLNVDNTITMADPGSDGTSLWSTYNWRNTSQFIYFKTK